MVEAVHCLECGSNRLFRAGLRYDKDGTQRQRWLCRDCGFRFSEPKIKINVVSKINETFDPSSNLAQSSVRNANFSVKKISQCSTFPFGEDVGSHDATIIGKELNSFCSYNSNRQVCASNKKAKNLNPTTETKTVVGDGNQQQDIKGKIVELCFYMQKQGYAEATIRLNRTALKVLSDRGANLADPESVKEVLAKQKIWSENRKRNLINAYTLFLKIQDLHWEKPKCKPSRPFPFIPKEQEIDALIAGCGKKLSAFLQLLKETAIRCGEAKRLLWTNIDSEKNIITLNNPEKGSNPRMWKISQKLTAMLNALPRESQQVFGNGPITSMKTTFQKSRKRLALKLQNPRLRQISFHTFRHWKATTLYHQTKDIYYVKDFLGHKDIRNTDIYINIERTMFEPSSDEFTVRVTDKTEETKTLLEAGFEYVCQKDNLIFLRKRK